MCNKVYAVKVGHRTGIMKDFNEYKNSLKGYKNSKGRSFKSKEQALLWLKEEQCTIKPVKGFVAVDASAIEVDGDRKFQYQVCKNAEGSVLLRSEVLYGDVNLAEFLALVKGMEYLYLTRQTTTPIYTDSKLAYKWVKQRYAQTNTKAINKKHKQKMYKEINKAQALLKFFYKNDIAFDIRLWNCSTWGENPAHFNVGRQGFLIPEQYSLDHSVVDNIQDAVNQLRVHFPDLKFVLKSTGNKIKFKISGQRKGGLN